ncbi:unnamed protein product [Orchesella dallaii]|uniref:CHK kinase-like domain-containing protein n=1 Tax=Orchesella dallaii TaxID=48710 RepID=A0ABP1PQ13_9HEXA
MPTDPKIRFSHEFLSTILKQHDPTLKLIAFDLTRGTSAEIPLVLKALPTNLPILKYMRELKAFEKEVLMFEAVFPELCQNLKYESLPKAIYTFCDSEDSYVIMEDLKSNGYRMADRINGLDFEHAKLAINEMAKFHALSFIKFHGNGQLILDKFPNLVDMFWVKPEDVTERNRMFINGQLDGLKKVMKEEDRSHVIPRIERSFSNVFERMHRLASIPENFPAVINLGDCWTNNMMFKYDDQGSVTDVKFLDFQLARVTSRCSDLAYLLYTSLKIPILNERFDELLHIYYDSFTSFVTANSSSADESSLLNFKGQELTWEFLQMEFEHYRSHGTTLALIYTPLMLPSFETVPDLDKVDGKDLENMGTDQSSDFANVWKCKAVREKLIAIASGHLPMCFKPAQPPPLSS